MSAFRQAVLLDCCGIEAGLDRLDGEFDLNFMAH